MIFLREALCNLVRIIKYVGVVVVATMSVCLFVATLSVCLSVTTLSVWAIVFTSTAVVIPNAFHVVDLYSGRIMLPMSFASTVIVFGIYFTRRDNFLGNNEIISSETSAEKLYPLQHTGTSLTTKHLERKNRFSLASRFAMALWSRRILVISKVLSSQLVGFM